MICAQCQTALPNNAAFCTRCGAPVTVAASAGQHGTPSGGPSPQATQAQGPATWGQPGSAQTGNAPAPAGSAAAPFRFDLRRLTPADRTIGIASLVMFISLFLPWFGIGLAGVNFTESGMSGHGYLAIPLILAIAIIIYLALRAGWDKLPVNLPVAHAPLLLVASGLQLLIVLIAFLFKPNGLDWEFGAYVALIAAVVACVPIGIPAMRSWNENRR